MTTNQVSAVTSNQATTGNGFTVDAKSIQISAVLVGVGGAICLAGLAIGGYAIYNAVSTWIGELEQPPTAYAMNTYTQAKAATAAGVRAWLDQQEQQALLQQQAKRNQPTTLRA